MVGTSARSHYSPRIRVANPCLEDDRLTENLLEERIDRTKCVKLKQLEGLTRVIVENVPHGVIKDDIDCRYIVKALGMCAGKADLEVVIKTGQ